MIRICDLKIKDFDAALQASEKLYEQAGVAGGDYFDVLGRTVLAGILLFLSRNGALSDQSIRKLYLDGYYRCIRYVSTCDEVRERFSEINTLVEDNLESQLAGIWLSLGRPVESLFFESALQICEVEIVNRSSWPLPSYETVLSAGMDLRANIEDDIVLKVGERVLVPTGIFVALPAGYEAQVRPRSGLALKSGVTVLNAPGTIDADYRGEVGVILINLGNSDFTVKPGDRIAQFVVARYERVRWRPVVELGQTGRGEGGFGSTGN